VLVPCTFISRVESPRDTRCHAARSSGTNRSLSAFFFTMTTWFVPVRPICHAIKKTRLSPRGVKAPAVQPGGHGKDFFLSGGMFRVRGHAPSNLPAISSDSMFSWWPRSFSLPRHAIAMPSAGRDGEVFSVNFRKVFNLERGAKPTCLASLLPPFSSPFLAADVALDLTPPGVVRSST